MCSASNINKNNSGCYLIKIGKYKTELARRKLSNVAKNKLRNNIINFVSFIFAQAVLYKLSKVNISFSTISKYFKILVKSEI